MKSKHLLLAGVISATVALGAILPIVNASALSDSGVEIAKEDKKEEKADSGKKALKPGTDCPKGSLGAQGKIKRTIYTLADCNIADADANQYDLMKTMTTVINVIVGCVGIIAVAVIVIGGITFATSQGDTAKTAKAKNTILFGVVGLVVALLAFAIVNFVLSGVFG